MADGTKEHYKLLKRRLISFKPRLTLNEIDSRFIDDFVYYLKVDLKTGNSGINSRIRDLNCVLKKLQNEKKISDNPCINYKKFEEKSGFIFLNPNELKRFITADLNIGNMKKSLEHTRNLFLFSCYTGLRDCDIKTLRKKEIIENKKIVKRQLKTKKTVEIPFNKYWFDILEENEFNKKRMKL